ncbi:hypothetical protein [Cellulomonas oligotrophica]|uniref:Uncharacterized protein n=1 Tax=Cellulomonas oligotrophica TaxID=931536 RepID=A0A7Y9JXR5_9CELL|nr:hypothetical protein [Cellulomonas oligotrophica]NYD84994.1 hypothetical protein [Cellulomonas oligotrophica]GIG33698.1 hypothetical protein Col01nite_28570 [Cellulomonas oligotrophica]
MHRVGDVVDGYELTPDGTWERPSPTAGSPYDLGDVVNGHMLVADPGAGLRWVPLRRAPLAPYAVGDVVEEHVLTPDGDWVHLAQRERTPPADAARAARTASARTGPTTTTRPAPAPRATVPGAAVSTTTPAPRPAPQRATAAGSTTTSAAQRTAAMRQPTVQQPAVRQAAAGAAPARPRYEVGDVVNGHVLTPDMRWEPVGRAVAAPRGQDPAPQPSTRTSGNPFGGLVVLAAIGFVVLRACTGG